MPSERIPQRRKYPVGEVRPSQLLFTYGVGSLVDLPHLSTLVECKSCGAKRSMADAFSSDEEQIYRPVCRGRRPHLRDFEHKTCTYQARTTLLAASNSWFPLIFSSLSIPTALRVPTNDFVTSPIL